ncbi:hypothetical protein ACIFOC_01778 [Leucobacter aridicollis]
MLGAELRRIRHRRGETLGETARRAGVSPQYLSEMERGSKDPSSEMIAAVAGALNVTLLDLTLAVADELRAGELRSGSLTAVPAARSPLAATSVLRLAAPAAPAAVGAGPGAALALAA